MDGLMVGADIVTQLALPAIVDGAARGRIPAVYPARDYIEAGLCPPLKVAWAAGSMR